MKPLYALLRERCGLSIREAAEFHAVPENAVASWSAGRRNPPAGVITELRLRYVQIDDAAARLVEIADKAPAPRLRSSSASLPMTTGPVSRLALHRRPGCRIWASGCTNAQPGGDRASRNKGRDDGHGAPPRSSAKDLTGADSKTECPTAPAGTSARPAISPEIALRLGIFFRNGPELRMRMQNDYDLWQAREKIKDELAKIEPTEWDREEIEE